MSQSLGKIEIHAKISRMGTCYIIYIPAIYSNLVKRYYKRPVKITIEPLQ
jgi:hypothetical protein